jgi:hypothetical protein
MSEQLCFKECPACAGTGNIPTGGDDFDECPWFEIWTEHQRLRARVAELEEAALLLFRTLADAPEDCAGVVPERHDCPAYPRRDEILHNAAPPIRHLLGTKDNG